jgi:hypothetical protein
MSCDHGQVRRGFGPSSVQERRQRAGACGDWKGQSDLLLVRRRMLPTAQAMLVDEAQSQQVDGFSNAQETYFRGCHID